MENKKLKIIRAFEKNYHDSLYFSKKLGEDGSWLKKPISSAISVVDKLGAGKLNILDLGCGPGRHAIPMAIKIQKEGGQVFGVDLLESAQIKFEENRKKFNIDTNTLHFLKIEIENYLIPVEFFDYILSVSALEHVKDKQTLEEVITSMIQGTRLNGINYLIFSTDNYLYNPINNSISEGMIEVNLKINEAQEFFEKLYKGWEITENAFIPWESIQIHTNEKIIQKGISYRFMAIKRSLL